MKRHVCTETRPGLSNIGFTGFSVTALPDCGKGIAPDAPPGFLLLPEKGCEAKYAFLPGNWGMTKTCGMVCFSLTISKNTTPSPSVCGNAKGCSTSWDLPCKDLAARLVKPILSNKRPLKKLLPMDERSQYSALVRRRGAFPKTQQPGTNVGTQRTTTSRALRLHPRESRLLWGAELENWRSSHPRVHHIQRRHLWRFPSSSPAMHQRSDLPHSGQRPLAQGATLERLLLPAPGPLGACLPAFLLARVESRRKGMEDHSPAGYSQPLLPVQGRSPNSLELPIRSVGRPQPCPPNFMRTYLRRYI
jgi:hypothetical protein